MTTQDQKPPERIYLQADSQGGYEIGRDATWCDHRINDEDVEYALASEPESVGPKVDRVLTFLKRVGPMVALRGSKESNDALDDIPKLLAILATHAKPPEPDGWHWMCSCGESGHIGPKDFCPACGNAIEANRPWAYLAKPTGESE